MLLETGYHVPLKTKDGVYVVNLDRAFSKAES
jgi:hypothetical protein